MKADLEMHVADLLATSGSVDASGVKVIAKGNRIHLAGHVHSLEEVERCKEIALSVEGVASVESDIGLQGNEETPDQH
ncbi:BON domain-containing protein [Rhizobium sp. C4]|uniref:BON domain-containing protein n=1 Tax=Rhizobium sp. C4 TaxID=1349800 RepID=UPI001E4233C0|nr:BON domain-containing protein [Rhizobium sp. C4]MCD2173555.1 BON domain-containing protein [Rhizobium sp. C4]